MEQIRLKLPGTKDSFVQEAYKALRTNLQFCGQDLKVIAITSCNENEGKTTVALQLAQSLAELGKSVLLIDADMRKSVMAGRNTNVKNVVGLSEILTGMVKLGDAMYETQEPSFRIIFAGQYPPNPVELLGGKYFKALLAESRKVFEYVIIDTPPSGMVIDAAAIAPSCDGTILVIGNTTTHYRQAQDVVSQLEKSGSKVLGVIRNNVKKKSTSHYYTYTYGEYGNNRHSSV